MMISGWSGTDTVAAADVASFTDDAVSHLKLTRQVRAVTYKQRANR